MRKYFYILAVLLGLFFITMGVMSLTSWTSVKFGVAAVGFGTVFIIAAIRGFLN